MIKRWISLGLLAFSLGCQSQDGGPQVEKGSIQYISVFPSQYIDARPVVIWKSPNFESTQEHITLFMQDGQMLFDSTLTWNHQEWHIDEHLSALCEQNANLAFVVVGIYNNGAKRHAEYFPQKPFENLTVTFQDSIYQHTRRSATQVLFAERIYSDAYLAFITQELKPFIEKNYGISRLENTWIGGASMGGLVSWYALNEYPNVFGAALCFSTHWPGVWPKDDPAKKVFDQMIKYQTAHPLGAHQKYYFDHGDLTLDQYYGPYQKAMDSVLNSQNSNFKTFFYPETDHSEKSWSAHFSPAVLWLLKK